MKLDPNTRQAFEPFLTAPPVTTPRLKSLVAEHRARWAAEGPAGALGTRLDRQGALVAALLGTVVRKTSPFYVRAIHGLAQLYLRPDRGGADLGLELDERVAPAVCRGVGRLDLLG